ncbi:MAG TPA: hypothetical protein VII99_07665 [Bacteroidia bacterium]
MKAKKHTSPKHAKNTRRAMRKNADAGERMRKLYWNMLEEWKRMK